MSFIKMLRYNSNVTLLFIISDNTVNSEEYISATENRELKLEIKSELENTEEQEIGEKIKTLLP